MPARNPLKIGISACFFHQDSQRPIFKGKTLLYLEQSLSQWVMSEGALTFLIPASSCVRNFVSELDGLILQGGSDVSPKSYGESPLRSEWSGDSIRDSYEIELLKEFVRQKKPVLGICRGAQLINVAFGGTLYQDIPTQVSQAQKHREWEIYDQLFHPVFFTPDSYLGQLYPGKKLVRVNSVHHQAIKDLGRGLWVEARSEGDQLIEAIRWKGRSYVFAVQWHPEFHNPKNLDLLDSKPILQDFLKEAKRRKKGEG